MVTKEHLERKSWQILWCFSFEMLTYNLRCLYVSKTHTNVLDYWNRKKVAVMYCLLSDTWNVSRLYQVELNCRNTIKLQWACCAWKSEDKSTNHWRSNYFMVDRVTMTVLCLTMWTGAAAKIQLTLIIDAMLGLHEWQGRDAKTGKRSFWFQWKI